MPTAENSGQPAVNRPASRAPFITRVVLRDYRSIEVCDVTLRPLTFLVGPNGSGKSNFLDALRLIADALRNSLDHAIRERGGIFNIVRRAPGSSGQFDIRLDFQLPDGAIGHFSVSVSGARTYVVQEEECAVGEARYHVRAGRLLLKPSPVSPPASDDRLYLVNAAGLPEFRPIFDALSNMGVYSINPEQLRALQPSDKGELLARDGANLSGVLNRLATLTGGHLKRRIEEYLGAIVPGLKGVEHTSVEHMETLKFLQHREDTEGVMEFPAITMSDGTLRALGILVALFQTRADQRIQLVGIEEPEVSLHPAAAGILRDALRDASQYAQVIVTSHSPELLDDPSIHGDELLSVVAEQGKSLIAPVDEETRSALRDRLYTAGELLKANQLSPDRSAVPQPDQLKLWEHDT